MPRHFPNWLQAYMQFTRDSEAPDDFHFWTGVSTVAGALRRRVWISMRKYDWTPNFYIVLVGPAGIVTKSTALRAGHHLLEQIPEIHLGPPSTTWQALTKALESAVEHVKIGTKPDGSDLFLPMSCITVAVSELGTFLRFDQSGFVEVITDLWDGQLSNWKHETATTGKTAIKNPWINVLGATTPSWMKDNVPEGAIGGGLMSRVVFVYGEKKRFLVPYPDEVIPDAQYADLELRLVEDLKEISQMVGPMTLTPRARSWGRDWYAKHWNGSRPNHMASDRFEGYLSRKQTHMHKLAIVLSAVRGDSMFVDQEQLEEAEQLLNGTERHMIKAFESIGIVEEARHVGEIMAFVRAHGPLTTDTLWSYVRNLMPYRDFEESLKSAVRADMLRVVEHPSERYDNGKPKRAVALKHQGSVH